MECYVNGKSFGDGEHSFVGSHGDGGHSLADSHDDEVHSLSDNHFRIMEGLDLAEQLLRES